MTLPPIIKSIQVSLPPDQAFDLFTRRMGEWWPLHTHACSPYALKAPARSVHVPDLVGGTVVETMSNGSTAPWGTVTEHLPAKRFAMTWHPGYEPELATYLSIDFVPEGGGTRITLTHSGWDARPDPAAARENYDGGWDGVLGQQYAEAARRMAA
jgi:hypothetical protein